MGALAVELVPHEPVGKGARLHLRVTQRQDRMIRSAADALDKTVTEFVLDSVSLAAQQVLSERQRFILSETEWNRFHELLERPVVQAEVSALRDFLTVDHQIDLSDL
jgi:uncharacterized protein (DUF1778 family)